MYIEQGYKSKLGLWSFFVIPVTFILFMAANYVVTINAPEDPEVMVQQLIDKLGSNIVLVLLLIPLVVGLFVVWGWARLIQQQKIRFLTTSRKRVDWQRILFSFGLWTLVTLALVFTDIALSPSDYVFNFNAGPFFTLLIIGTLLIPLQTSFEEYLFRAHLMQGLGLLTKNKGVPFIVTSVLFGLMHLGNPEVGKLGLGIMVYYIGTGLFLGILTLMDEGLELSLGFHAANNLVGALLVTSSWSAFQTDSIYKDISEPVLGWDVFVPVLVIFPILLWIFSKKYGWTNWKEKLFGRVLSRAEVEVLEEHQDA